MLLFKLITFVLPMTLLVFGISKLFNMIKKSLK